jgi:predicted transcriptional regulator
MVALDAHASVGEAIRLMGENYFSQVPVMQTGRVVGSLNETHVYAAMVRDPKIRHEPVKTVMHKAFRYVDIETPVPLLAPMITPEQPAVLVKDFPSNETYLLTGYDVLAAL